MGPIVSEETRLRRFGWAVGTAFVLASAFFAWQEVYRAAAALSIPGGCLLLAGGVRPRLLRPVERVWTAAGSALGWFNTRLVLGLVFATMVTPLGLILRLLGRDGLGWRPEPARATYLVPKRVRIAPPESFERQY